MQTVDSTYNKINFSRLAIFLIISITLSNVFRFDVFGINDFLKQLPTGAYLFMVVLLEGSGVLVGAIIGITLMRRNRPIQISFFGTSSKYSLMLSIVPIVVLTCIGVKNSYALNSHVYGFLVSLVSLCYCSMEEMGWRGYLEEEFKSLKPIKRYFGIGLIWYVWHLSFLTEATLADNLVFCGLLILGSWGIGQVVEATKFILACACFHLLIQMMMFNNLVKEGLSGSQKLIVLGLCIVVWIWILKKMKVNSVKKS